MKLLNGELPTMERMFERFPLVYKNNFCVRCDKEIENHLHIFTCEKNLIDVEMCRDKFISLLVNQINIGATNSSCKDISSLIDNLQEIKIIDSSSYRNPDEFSFADVLSGLIPLSLQKLIRPLTETADETNHLLHIVMEKFYNYIYKNIWVKRCSEVKSWKIANGIKNNKQKRKVGPPIVTNTVTSIVPTSIDNNSKISRDKKLLKNICFNIVKKYLFSFIQSNVNWTGLYRIGCSAGP